MNFSVVRSSFLLIASCSILACGSEKEFVEPVGHSVNVRKMSNLVDGNESKPLAAGIYKQTSVDCTKGEVKAASVDDLNRNFSFIEISDDSLLHKSVRRGTQCTRFSKWHIESIALDQIQLHGHEITCSSQCKPINCKARKEPNQTSSYQYHFNGRDLVVFYPPSLNVCADKTAQAFDLFVRQNPS